MVFDVVSFIEEYSRPDNFINTKESTWQSVTEYCEKDKKTWRVAGNGTHYLVKKFWCRHDGHGPDKERPCKICSSYKEWSRKKEVKDKLAVAFSSSSTLYLATTGNNTETKRLLKRLRAHGGKHLSIPMNDNGGKVFLLDMYDKVSDPFVVDLQTAAAYFLPLRGNTEWGYFSGPLGKIDEQDEDDTIAYTIPSRLNVTVPNELMIGVETEAVLTIGIDMITNENAQGVVRAKLLLIDSILRESGFPYAEHIGEQEINISLRKLKSTWFSAKIMPVSETDLKSYPTGISMEIDTAARTGLEQLKKRNREYMALQADAENDS
jgi:hypothetical protein